MLVTKTLRWHFVLAGVALLAGWPQKNSKAQQTPAGASLSLEAATTAALASSPTTRAGAQQLAQAQAKVAQAEAQRRLQITFNSAASGSNGRVIQGPPDQETFGTLQNTLTVPLPFGARPRLAVTQAQAQFAAAQAQYAAARLALVGQVDTAYYNLLRNEALLQIAQETQTQANRQLVAAKRRNRAGDVPALDVLRAQVPVASAQSGLYGAQNAVAVARQTLNGLIGHSLEAPLAIGAVAPSQIVLPYTLEQARALALQYSPDVRAADATIRADEAALQSARLSREPTFALQASDTRSGDQTAFSRLDTVQASVTVPLSDGGLARGQIQEAQAALTQAQAQAEGARRTALVTVSGAYLTAQSAQQQVASAQVARSIAQTVYEKTRLGYDEGLFPLSDALNAQTALAQARISETQAVYDAAVAIRVLENATGRGRP